jgi:large subunit ribosomal protein L17
MRHRRRSRVLGRSPSHRKALLRNLAKALILTEDPTVEPGEKGAPKVRGRIVTTLQKAKEVRSLVEKCVTLGCKAHIAQEAARPFGTTAARRSEEWTAWRKSDDWKKWAQAMAPVVTARRRVVSLLAERGDEIVKGDKRVIRVLFNVIAPRFLDRKGGYTRVVRLAKPRLGDAGTRAILEFVGVRDRQEAAAPAPRFEE